MTAADEALSRITGPAAVFLHAGHHECLEYEKEKFLEADKLSENLRGRPSSAPSVAPRTTSSTAAQNERAPL